MNVPMGRLHIGLFDSHEPMRRKKDNAVVEGMFKLTLVIPRGAREIRLTSSYFEEDYMGQPHPFARWLEDNELPKQGTLCAVYIGSTTQPASGYVNDEPLSLVVVGKSDEPVGK